MKLPPAPQIGASVRAGLFITLIAAGFILFLVFYLHGAYIEISNEVEYPKDINGAEVVNVLSGTRALEALMSIHEGRFSVEASVIARYKDGTVLWIARSNEADSLVARMARAMLIRREVIPYELIGIFEVGSCRVYVVVDAQGTLHFFWSTIGSRNDLVIWLDTSTKDYEAAIAKLMYVARYYGCTS